MKNKNPRFLIVNGKIWFSRETERMIFFYATIIMFFIWIIYEVFQ